MKTNTTQRILMTAGLVALLTVSTAFGQARRATADIPFQFAAGDQVLAAGKYFIEVSQSLNRIQLVSQDGATRVSVMTHRGDRKIPTDRAALVFKRYGTSRFLGQIALSGEADTYELSRTRAEKELARISRPLEEVAEIPVLVR